MKKRQQRVLMILDSKNVGYEVIDITEPGKEDEKEFMQTMSTARDSKYPLPPQIFNEDDYCGASIISFRTCIMIILLFLEFLLYFLSSFKKHLFHSIYFSRLWQILF